MSVKEGPKTVQQGRTSSVVGAESQTEFIPVYKCLNPQQMSLASSSDYLPRY